MWRHGDVLIAAVQTLPEGATRRSTNVLAHGEITGHSHHIQRAGTAELWSFGGELYINVVAASATIVHEEHKPISLPQGVYRVWMQREYTPQMIRRVID